MLNKGEPSVTLHEAWRSQRNYNTCAEKQKDIIPTTYIKLVSKGMGGHSLSLENISLHSSQIDHIRACRFKNLVLKNILCINVMIYTSFTKFNKFFKFH